MDAYLAPSKTFEDVKRDASWWFPFLLTAFLAVVFSYVVLNKIGLPTLIDGVVHQTPSLEERLANSTPEQAEALRHGMEMQFKFMYVSPLIFIVVGMIVAAIFLGTANFVFGGTRHLQADAGRLVLRNIAADDRVIAYDHYRVRRSSGRLVSTSRTPLERTSGTT